MDDHNLDDHDDALTVSYMLGYERGKAAALRAAAEREKEYEAALRFYSDPSKYTDIHGDDVTVPDFYSELDFGETARTVLAKHEKPAAS